MTQVIRTTAPCHPAGGRQNSMDRESGRSAGGWRAEAILTFGAGQDLDDEKNESANTAGEGEEEPPAGLVLIVQSSDRHSDPGKNDQKRVESPDDAHANARRREGRHDRLTIFPGRDLAAADRGKEDLKTDTDREVDEEPTPELIARRAAGEDSEFFPTSEIGVHGNSRICGCVKKGKEASAERGFSAGQAFHRA